MSGDRSPSRFHGRGLKWVRIGGALAVAVGLTVLSGWIVGSLAIVSVLPGLATMKVNTAIGFVLAGASLWLAAGPGVSRRSRRRASALGLAVTVIAVATLGEIWLHADFHIDQLLLRDPFTNAALAAPGRMSLATALCFLFIGAGLALLHGVSDARERGGQLLVCLGGGLGAIGVLGYLFGGRAVYGTGAFSSMAIHTALLMVLVSVGALLADADVGFMAPLASPHAGGTLARRALPLMALVVIVTFWLRLRLQRAGLVNRDVGTAAAAAMIVLLGTGGIWLAARSLNRLHGRLLEADQLRSLLASIVRSSDDAIVGKTLDGTVTSWNAGAERLFGYKAEEMIGRPITRIMPPDRLHEQDLILPAARSGQRIEPFDTVRLARDGTLVPVSLSASPMRDEAGETIGAAQIARDIRVRLQAEQALRDSEFRFRQVTESLPQLIWTSEPDGTCNYFGPQWRTYTGTSGSTDAGYDWLEPVDPEQREASRGRWRAAVAAGDAFSAELRLRRHDGAYRWFDVQAVALRDGQGRITNWLGVCTDVHERRLADEHLRGIVEAVPNALVIVDQERSVRLVNRKAEEIFGYTRRDIVGRSLDLLVPARLLPVHTREVSEFFETPSVRPMGVGRALLARRRDGSEFPVEIGLAPIETAEGLLTLAAVLDVTEHKKYEEELKRSNEELERFAYIASHDLKEPLRAVAGCLQLLEKRYGQGLEDRAHELIGHAVEGADRMQTLIDGLLAFARVSTRGGAFAPLEVDAAVDVALKNLATAVAESGAVITRDPLPRVFADPTQITLVYQNLVGNALKFRGDAPPRIHLGAEPWGAGWRLSVRDNGIGIEPRHAERIFVIFQRLHTRREYPGTGLGLALCERIVARHGGSIWVESTPGQGATFFFTLPAVRPPVAGPDAGHTDPRRADEEG